LAKKNSDVQTFLFFYICRSKNKTPVKKILSLLLPFFPFLIFSSAPDTIDYWKVYYNNGKLKELSFANESRKITVKEDSVSEKDSITVYYFKDRPCSKCATNLFVEDDKNHPVMSGSGMGTGKPISFSIYDLVEFKKRSGMNYYELWYKEDNSISPKVFLCRIKIE
jgi:hypothetical protein